MHLQLRKEHFLILWPRTLTRGLDLQVTFNQHANYIVKGHLVLCPDTDTHTHIHWTDCSICTTTVVSKNCQQVVKVIWEKAASPPHMDGSIIFARWRQCAAHPHASFGPPVSTTQTASRSIQQLCRAHDCDRTTDRPTNGETDRPRYSVCNNRPHLRTRSKNDKFRRESAVFGVLTNVDRYLWNSAVPQIRIWLDGYGIVAMPLRRNSVALAIYSAPSIFFRSAHLSSANTP